MFCIVEYVFTEAATGSVLYTKVFLKFSQNSQESTCARVFIKKETLAQTFSCEFGEIFKNTFFYRTPLVDASTLAVFCKKSHSYKFRKFHRKTPVLKSLSTLLKRGSNTVVFRKAVSQNISGRLLLFLICAVSK